MQRQGLSEPELDAIAVALGEVLEAGDVVLLSGPMGAGKTTLTRALARGLRVDRPQRVCSPTFNICLQHAGPTPLWHVDLFRLAETGGDQAPTTSAGSVGASAFEALGLEALLDDGEAASGVLVVEWADLWADPPSDHLRVQLAIAGDRRNLSVGATGPRHAARLAAWSRRAAP